MLGLDNDLLTILLLIFILVIALAAIAFIYLSKNPSKGKTSTTILVSGFLLIIFMTSALGLGASILSNDLAEFTVKIHRHPLTVSNAAMRIRVDIAVMRQNMVYFSLAKNADDRKLYISLIDKHEKEVYELFDIIQERFLGDKSIIENTLTTFSKWTAIRTDIYELSRVNPTLAIDAIRQGAGFQHFSMVESQVEKLIFFANNKANEFLSSSKKHHQQGIIALYLLVGAVIGFSLLVAYFVIRKVQNAEEDQDFAVNAAEKANKAKSEFLSSMSHELRTPMSAILGFGQMLGQNPEEPLTETQQQSVNYILRGGNHLLRLIEEVLELSKIEAGQLSLTVDHVPARGIIDECLPQVQLTAEKNDIEIIDATSENDLPLLWSDETRLRQVLLNLLSNAVKYNRTGGTVTISSQELPNRMLRISVADTGEGIPADKQENLFLPFDRLGRETGTIEGTGIGLTITKNIVEVLGGKIDFESEEGKGSTFWVDFPMSEKQGINAANVKIAKSGGELIGKLNEAGSQHSVLYVEDDPDNIQLMELMIGQFNNVKLLTAHNAEFGLGLARRHKPDLILMDINLPQMDGYEALERLKINEETSSIPVIAITAQATKSEIRRGRHAGFEAYLTKPINVQETLQVIEDTIKSD